MSQSIVTKALAAATLCCLVSPVAARADTPTKPAERGTVTILFENDLFFDTDRDYTDGVQAAWTSPVLPPDDWAVNFAKMLPFFSPGTDVRKSYIVGQDMFTPSDISLKNPPRTDHPYAGYLYAGLGVVSKTPAGNGSVEHLDQVELQFGMVGPASLAEQTQKFIHGIRNIDKPQGWDTQLKNEPGLVLKYQRSWRFSTPIVWGFQMQLDPHAGAAIGNVYDYANIGAMARFGFDLPDDYGPVRADPSLPGSYFFEPENGNFGWYLFAGIDSRLVGRNIFLDGNSFVHSRSVDKEPFVTDFELGAAIMLYSARLSFTHVYRTKEYETQKGEDQFGSVSLSWRY